MDRIKPGPNWEQLNGMGGPDDDDTPTPNSMPLVEGGNPAWNDVLQYVPEDKRTEVVPKLQEWDNNYKQVQESLTPWKQFVDSGVDPETAQIALNVLQTIETNPEAVYEAIGKSLGISKQEAEELVEEVTEEGQANGSGITQEQFEALAKQSNAMAQILLAKREEETLAQQEAELNKELATLKEKYGDFPENEIVYRMLHSDMSAEDALKDYAKFEENLFRSRPVAPRVLSGGGMIPQPKVDPVKLDDRGTRDHVAEMLKAALQQNQ